MNTDEMIFDDLEPIQVPVTLNKRRYVLREGTADVVRKWRNRMMRDAKLGGSGRPTTVNNIADADIYLLAMCLYKVDDKDGMLLMGRDNRPDPKQLVPEGVILSWPHRVQKQLLERLQDITDLNPKETAEQIRTKIRKLEIKLHALTNGASEGVYGDGNAPLTAPDDADDRTVLDPAKNLLEPTDPTSA